MLLLNTTRFIGIEKEETDNLLNYLYDYIAYSQESQVSARWDEKMVVIFDIKLPILHEFQI